MAEAKQSLASVAAAWSLAALLAGAAQAQTTYDMYSYWLMPQGLVAKTVSVKNGVPINGEHCFWRGTLWGKTVALQADPSVTQYDIFVDVGGTRLDYWATFRGNAYRPNADLEARSSHVFGAPFIWVNRSMKVGDVIQGSMLDKVLDPNPAKIDHSGTVNRKLTVDEYHPTWDSPAPYVNHWQDVLKITYYSNLADPKAKEVYYLAKGKGWVYFETGDPSQPSQVWATGFENKTVANPTLPWFDPFPTPATYPGFLNTGFVPNGYFEELKPGAVNGGPVSTSLTSWTGSSNDVVITTDLPYSGLGKWKVGMRGSNQGADAVADFAITSSFLPVTPGKRYRLTGWLLRAQSTDNVYLDFDDGRGDGGNFADGQAMAQQVGVWETRSVDVTVGAQTKGVKIRCVRDGANKGNAYCDGIQLQRLD
jgi:hypothetical protein